MADCQATRAADFSMSFLLTELPGAFVERRNVVEGRQGEEEEGVRDRNGGEKSGCDLFELCASVSNGRD